MNHLFLTTLSHRLSIEKLQKAPPKLTNNTAKSFDGAGYWISPRTLPMLVFLTSSVHTPWSVQEMNDTHSLWSFSKSLGSDKIVQAPGESSSFCWSQTCSAPFGRLPRDFTPPNSVAVFPFHLQIVLIQHGLSAVALTRGTGRMQLHCPGN